LFVPDKAFPNWFNICGVRPGAYIRVEHLQGSSLRKAQDLLENYYTKVCHGKPLAIKKIQNYGGKKFSNSRPCIVISAGKIGTLK
jgi:hypothetical protein